MKSFLKIVLVFLVVTLFNVRRSYSQQDPHYTQYMYNTMSVNPAYAGAKGHSHLVLLGRTQWVGFDGAPNTQTLGYDTTLSSYSLGLGFNLVNDAIGPSRETSLDTNISYHIATSDESKLSLGLKLGGRFFSVNPYSVGKLGDKTDINLPRIKGKFLPTVGAGLYYYTQKFYAGLSVPNFLRTEHFDANLNNGNGNVAVERFHFFLITGYVFDLSESVKFKPAAILKGVSGAPVSLDVSANFLFNNKFSAGLAWRWGDSISALLGFNVTDKFQVGFAYDLTTTNIGKYNSGTYEVMLSYDFLRQGAIASPRFF